MYSLLLGTLKVLASLVLSLIGISIGMSIWSASKKDEVKDEVKDEDVINISLDGCFEDVNKSLDFNLDELRQQVDSVCKRI